MSARGIHGEAHMSGHMIFFGSLKVVHNVYYTLTDGDSVSA